MLNISGRGVKQQGLADIFLVLSALCVLLIAPTPTEGRTTMSYVEGTEELLDSFEEATEKANICIACAETHHVNAAEQMRAAKEHMMEARRIQRRLVRTVMAGGA